MLFVPIKIANDIGSLPWLPNNMCTVTVQQKLITLALHNNNITAFASKCPHGGVPLQEGYLDAMGRVVCPKHFYKFCTNTGRNTSGEGYCLKTYKVTVEATGVYLTGL